MPNYSTDTRHHDMQARETFSWDTLPKGSQTFEVHPSAWWDFEPNNYTVAHYDKRGNFINQYNCSEALVKGRPDLAAAHYLMKYHRLVGSGDQIKVSVHTKKIITETNTYERHIYTWKFNR